MFFLCRKNGNTNLIRSCFSYVINTDYADFTLLFTDGPKSAWHQFYFPEVESSRTSLASRTHFEVLGLGLEGQVLGLGLEASSPRKLACPRLEDSTSF